MTYYFNQRMRKGFTLMELMTVVVIIGIMASFAIPNYTRSVERAHRRDATANLISLHAANQILRSETNDYWPSGPGWFDLAQINTALRLAIVANGLEYQCRDLGAVSYECQACRPSCGAGSTFTVTVNQAAIGPGNPACGGACP